MTPPSTTALKEILQCRETDQTYQGITLQVQIVSHNLYKAELHQQVPNQQVVKQEERLETGEQVKVAEDMHQIPRHFYFQLEKQANA